MYVKPSFRERWGRRFAGLRRNSLFYPRRWAAGIHRLFRRAKSLRGLLTGELVVARATLRVVKIERGGRHIDYGVVSRKKVTQAFVKDLAATLAASAGPYATFNDYKFHGSGTDNTGESNAQTALITEVATRSTGTQVDFSSGTTGNYRTVATITYGASFTIVEHGLFNADPSGTMLDRSVFAGIAVASGDSIQFTYELTISAES